MRMFAAFLETLRDMTDADGRALLDSTVVMFGSGMGDASRHSNEDVPVLVAGGGLRHGGFHDYRPAAWSSTAERPTLSNLYVTLLRRMGVEAERFANSNGDLDRALV